MKPPDRHVLPPGVRRRTIVALVLVGVGLLLVLRSTDSLSSVFGELSAAGAAPANRSSSSSTGGAGTGAGAGAGAGKAVAEPPRVPVTLFVMSICPDARFCETAFARILQPLQDLVQLDMEYIASLDPRGGQNVTCKHGEMECDGNRHQLCVKHYTPVGKRLAWLLPTISCLWSDLARIGSLEGLTTCLNEVGIVGTHQAAVLQCAAGPLGKQLQHQSARVVEQGRVAKSCTVFIASKKRCVRDGGAWYDCPGGSSDDEFKKTICQEYLNLTSVRAPACDAVLRT